MSVVVISTVTFVLGTMPELTDNLDIMLFDNETEVHLLSGLSSVIFEFVQVDSSSQIESTTLPNTVQPMVERWEEVILFPIIISTINSIMILIKQSLTAHTNNNS